MDLTSNPNNESWNEPIFKIDTLWASICPNQTTYNSYTSVRRGGGGHTYKRVEKTCSWAKEIFRGFSVTSAGRLTHGSTFGVTIDSKLKDITKKSESQINSVVQVLLEKYRQGKDPNSILNSADVTRHFNGTQNETPYFMRASLDGTAPIPLITAGHMYQLMQLITRDSVDQEYADASSAYAQALSRVSQAASYVHTIDHLSALLTKTLEKCGSDPDLKSAVAQKNCQTFTHQLEAQLKILAERRQAEESYYRTQDEVNQFVQAELLRRRDVVEPKYAPLPKAYSQTITVPTPRL